MLKYGATPCRGGARMRKERLAYFRKRLVEKQRQLTEEVGRTALYGKDQEDDSIKDLGDQANTAYNREFFFELGNGDRRLLRDVVSALQKMDDGGVGSRGAGGGAGWGKSAWRRCRSRATASTASASSSKRSGWPRASRPPGPHANRAPRTPALVVVSLLASLRTLVSLGAGPCPVLALP